MELLCPGPAHTHSCAHTHRCAHARAGEVHTPNLKHAAGNPGLRALPGATLCPFPPSSAAGDEGCLCHILAKAFMKPHTSISCCLELPQPLRAPSEL